MDYHSDHLGSSRLMTNAQGTVVAGSQSSFLPYGYEYTPQSYDNHYKFTGLERDAETGVGNELDHAWFRQYSPRIGRWMSPDPAGLAAVDMTNPQTWNRYAYVVNNPIILIDPLGLWCNWTGWDGVEGHPSITVRCGPDGGAGNGGAPPHLPESPADTTDGGSSGGEMTYGQAFLYIQRCAAKNAGSLASTLRLDSNGIAGAYAGNDFASISNILFSDDTVSRAISATQEIISNPTNINVSSTILSRAGRFEISAPTVAWSKTITSWEIDLLKHPAETLSFIRNTVSKTKFWTKAGTLLKGGTGIKIVADGAWYLKAMIQCGVGD